MELKIDKNMIERFKNFLVLEEKSDNTIEKYLRDIHAFWKYVGEQIVTKELAIKYKENLLSDEYAVRSINSMIASLNSFFIFVGCEHLKILKSGNQLSYRESDSRPFYFCFPLNFSIFYGMIETE